jgi:two-component system sensor histidine kinase KdpD
MSPAVTVATIVDHSLRLSRRAANATAEAETLSSMAGSILRGDQAVDALLRRTREAFGMDSAELVHRTGVESEPAGAAVQDEGTDVVVPVGPDDVLVLRGRRLAASERRVLVAFAGHVAAALERARLIEAAAEVEPVKAADRMRTVLLAAVSHDLRTPIASGWAAVSSPAFYARRPTSRSRTTSLPCAGSCTSLSGFSGSRDRTCSRPSLRARTMSVLSPAISADPSAV